MGAGMAVTPGKTARGSWIAAGALALLALGGCGTERDTIWSADLLGGLLPGAGAGSGAAAAAAPVSEQDIANALARTDGPLMLALSDDQSSWSFLVRIERNGGFDTYANDRRQSMTMQSGVITATRGFGGDLMTSDLSGVLPLIRNRTGGTGLRIMQFLDGEDRTRTLRLTCTITRGDPAEVALPDGVRSTIAMTETCRGDDGAPGFANTYLVDDTGTVLGARQWLGALPGTMLFQTFRL